MEILLRIVDRSGREDDSKAGDAVWLQPDGYAWSQEERTYDAWRIVRVDLLQTTLDALFSSSRGRVPGVVRRRDWKVDFSKLPDPTKFAGPRTDAIIDLTRGQFMAAMTKKP